MNEYVFQDSLGQNIYLTFTPELFSRQPDHVLIVPLYQGKLLFTCHPHRGWELPGGKVEPGETAEDAVIREAWEETGAKVTVAGQLGEYRVEGKMTRFRKAIFLAHVLEWDKNQPLRFETMDAQLFPVDVDVHKDQFSPFMRDGVMEQIQKRLG
ncbi:NUDIX domain-containing protein [Ammoniphilus sp. 3BR4]|uniref:NUDIX domain-containing protein n=1 Tax=Ammoniphilus sp. 3BR4 TaxID=3158265 RepID=UPI003467C9BC